MNEHCASHEDTRARIGELEAAVDGIEKTTQAIQHELVRMSTAIEYSERQRSERNKMIQDEYIGIRTMIVEIKKEIEHRIIVMEKENKDFLSSLLSEVRGMRETHQKELVMINEKILKNNTFDFKTLAFVVYTTVTFLIMLYVTFLQGEI